MEQTAWRIRNELVAQIGDDSERILLRVRLLYRAVAGGNETLVARLLRAGVPVEGWRHFNHKKQNSPRTKDTDTSPRSLCQQACLSSKRSDIAGASVTLTARHGLLHFGLLRVTKAKMEVTRQRHWSACFWKQVPPSLPLMIAASPYYTLQQGSEYPQRS